MRCDTKSSLRSEGPLSLRLGLFFPLIGFELQVEGLGKKKFYIKRAFTMENVLARVRDRFTLAADSQFARVEFTDPSRGARRVLVTLADFAGAIISFEWLSCVFCFLFLFLF